MSKIPTLEEIVHAVESLPLKKRRKAPQGRKAVFPDAFIIALAVYQKLASFRYAQKMPRRSAWTCQHHRRFVNASVRCSLKLSSW